MKYRQQSTWFQMLAPLSVGILFLLVAIFSVGLQVTVSWWSDWWQPVVLGVVACLGLYLIPGLALLRWFASAWQLPLGVRIPLAIGISCVLPPILYQLTDLLGIPINRWTSWVYILTMTGWYIWPLVRQRRWPNIQLNTSLITGATLGVVLVSLLYRFLAIRNLIVPMWSDSVHHTLITQLLIDNQGLFDSWQPYVELQTLTYHMGFHSNVALFHWLTNIPAHTSVLLLGQIVNLWSVITVAGITRLLTNSRTAALWALFLTGLINITPAFYVTWGRYTQLIGQAALLTVLSLSILVLDERRWNIRSVILATIVLGGLLLTHYVMSLWGAICLLVLGLIILARYPERQDMLRNLGKGIIMVVGALLIALPWFINVFQGRLLRIASGYTSGRVGANAIGEATALGVLVPTHIQGIIMALVPLGIFIALRQRRWYLVLMFLWAVVLYLSIIGAYFGVPIQGVITGFAVAIGLYNFLIPPAAAALGAIADGVCNWFGQRASRTWQRIGQTATQVGIIGGLLVGIWWAADWQPQIIDPNWQLFSQADAQALDWINQHVPEDAYFLVNTTFIYSDKAVMANDGGAWIPYWTHRKTTTPPLPYGGELGPVPNYPLTVLEFFQTLQAQPLPSPTAVAYLKEHGIDYIYAGPVTSGIAPQILHDYEAMRQLPEIFEIIYEQDGIIIFALRS